MSKTAQRKRQAYEEGLRHGRKGYGCQYLRNPFMESYMRGIEDGKQLNLPPTVLGLFRRWFA